MAMSDSGSQQVARAKRMCTGKRRYRTQGDALDAALRRLLARFRLPGEAQQIDRVVEAFSRSTAHISGTSANQARNQ